MFDIYKQNCRDTSRLTDVNNNDQKYVQYEPSNQQISPSRQVK